MQHKCSCRDKSEESSSDVPQTGANAEDTHHSGTLFTETFQHKLHFCDIIQKAERHHRPDRNFQTSGDHHQERYQKRFEGCYQGNFLTEDIDEKLFLVLHSCTGITVFHLLNSLILRLNLCQYLVNQLYWESTK